MNSESHIQSHLSREELLGYHRHSLPADQTRKITEHLGSCPLCADALKGVAEMADVPALYSIMHDLRRKMWERLKPKKKIVYRMELIIIIVTFFILALILYFGYLLVTGAL